MLENKGLDLMEMVPNDEVLNGVREKSLLALENLLDDCEYKRKWIHPILGKARLLQEDFEEQLEKLKRQ